MRGLSGWLGPLLRVGVGVAFVALGALKAADPIAFLKVLREYGVFPPGPAMNAVAALLPFLEIGLGLLLILGVAVRGSALIASVLLLVFTGLVVWRGVVLAREGGVPLCRVSFDCGCGTGVVNVCRKGLENAFLLLASFYVLFSDGASRAAWKPSLFAR